MSTKIDFSPGETAVLGLKVGRCNSDALFDEKQLYDQILAGSYDICRLKIPAEDEMASVRLHKMGLPFFFSGSIRRYKTKISDPPAGSYNIPDLVFERYDGTQDQLLRDMLTGTWGTYPIGYYRTPYLERIVSKEQEIESVFQFYKKYNLYLDYPDNSILFIKHGESYVGFFALNILCGNLESHIGGILQPYRKSGYFLDMLRYIKEFCIRHRLEHFIFGARNENAEVQRVFQYAGFQPRGSENVFHIPSLLTYTHMPPEIVNLDTEGKGASLIYQQVLSTSLAIAQKINPVLTDMSFHINGLQELAGKKKAILQITNPVSDSDEILLSIKKHGETATPFTAYLRVFKR